MTINQLKKRLERVEEEYGDTEILIATNERFYETHTNDIIKLQYREELTLEKMIEYDKTEFNDINNITNEEVHSFAVNNDYCNGECNDYDNCTIDCNVFKKRIVIIID